MGLSELSLALRKGNVLAPWTPFPPFCPPSQERRYIASLGLAETVFLRSVLFEWEPLRTMRKLGPKCGKGPVLVPAVGESVPSNVEVSACFLCLRLDGEFKCQGHLTGVLTPLTHSVRLRRLMLFSEPFSWVPQR